MLCSYVSEYIKRISNELKFRRSLVSRMLFWYGYVEGVEILRELKKPCPYHTLRVNTLKVSREELMDMLEEEGIECEMHDIIEEAILIRVEGPFKVPLVDKRVIAYKSAAEGVMRGSDLYSTGVREVPDDIDPGDEVNVVDKFDQVVGYGISKISGEIMLRRGSDVKAVEVIESIYRVPKLRDTTLWKSGYFYTQTIPSMLASYVLDPKPGEKILDMCASPGGKTTHIAQMTKMRAKLLSVDNSNRKVRILKENLRRLGIKRNVRVIKKDARRLPSILGEEKFDKVLLDPPCSSIGIRPKLFDGTGERSILVSATYQRTLLKSAYKLLKKGGVLLYTTCTMDPAENELNVNFMLEKYNMELLDQKFKLGSGGLPLVPMSSKMQVFYPHKHMSPGFFIALLKK
ncbi:MAG: methyltransferase domain-containing protein [Candidatus Asgardarchaeia archaeon]